jgi:ketosteroid isomerase-like protein
MDEPAVFAAKAAITETITRYATLNDAADWEAVAALYTEDARMNRPSAPQEFVSGRAAILAALRARPPRATRHVIVNVLVTLEGPARARAVSQILLFTGQAEEGKTLPVLAGLPLVGTYEDTLVRTSGGWRFSERCGRLDFSP